jgi:hypothetical protein
MHNFSKRALSEGLEPMAGAIQNIVSFVPRIRRHTLSDLHFKGAHRNSTNIPA